MGVRTAFGRLRSQWADLLLAAVSVIVAGTLTTALADLHAEGPVPGTLGEPLAITDTGQTIDVVDVELGVAMQSPGAAPERQLRSDGTFVVIRMTSESPADAPVTALSCTLGRGDVEIRSVLGVSGITLPEPGFRRQEDIVFELARGNVEGARILCRRIESVTAYSPVYTFDLGLTAEAEDEAHEQGAVVVVRPFPTDEVL